MTRIALVAATLGCGLVAGVFFAFSTFVMAGLERLPAAQGIAAMQSINRTVINPLFMTAFVGTALLCVGLAIWAGLSLGDRRALWVLGGAALYIVGTFAVTMAFNVPLNDALDGVRAQDAAAVSEWEHFLATWTAWNHVRTVTGLGAAGLLAAALAA